MEFKGLPCINYDTLPPRVRQIADLLPLSIELSPAGSNPQATAIYHPSTDILGICRTDCTMKLRNLQTPSEFDGLLTPSQLSYTHLDSGLVIAIPNYSTRTTEQPVFRDSGLILDDSELRANVYKGLLR